MEDMIKKSIRIQKEGGIKVQIINPPTMYENDAKIAYKRLKKKIDIIKGK